MTRFEAFKENSRKITYMPGFVGSDGLDYLGVMVFAEDGVRTAVATIRQILNQS